jgi:hypothetical protein
MPAYRFVVAFLAPLLLLLFFRLLPSADPVLTLPLFHSYSESFPRRPPIAPYRLCNEDITTRI